MTVLRCDGVALAYEGQSVLEDVSFSLSQGDYLCVVGENGSGKSSLIKAVLGLKSPSKGKIELLSLKKKDIGYLPQQDLSQRDFPASVQEIVLSGALGSLRGFFYKASDKKRAELVMKRLGIFDIRKKAFSRLSGGQQQRVLLARALIAAKKLLVLDEPAAGLDPAVTKLMYEVIGEANAGENMSVIMISHDVEQAVGRATHILHLGDSVKFFGRSEEYVKTDEYRSLFGGSEA